MSPRWLTGTPTLPTSPRASGMIQVIACLRRQIEGDGKASLPLRQILQIQLVRRFRVRMARIGAEDPGLVGHGFGQLTFNESKRRLRCTIADACPGLPNPFNRRKLRGPRPSEAFALMTGFTKPHHSAMNKIHRNSRSRRTGWPATQALCKIKGRTMWGFLRFLLSMADFIL